MVTFPALLPQNASDFEDHEAISSFCFGPLDMSALRERDRQKHISKQRQDAKRTTNNARAVFCACVVLYLEVFM